MKYLEDHPLLGMLTALTGSGVAFIEEVTPWIKFAAATVGLLIGCLTLYSKVIKIWKEGK